MTRPPTNRYREQCRLQGLGLPCAEGETVCTALGPVARVPLYQGCLGQSGGPSYGVENMKRIQKAARNLDPQAFFQRQQSDGFLLRNLSRVSV
ncbi:uncharacterized protein BDV17DRAFT_278269 [Aspergillus undulatus]|uniref:uncharacterized protein n=1 Tax=Aspergillus undulatus TaxID=1810928 RepID=UPI003CCCFD35